MSCNKEPIHRGRVAIMKVLKVVLNGTEEEKKCLNNIGIEPAGSARWRKMSGIGLRLTMSD